MQFIQKQGLYKNVLDFLDEKLSFELSVQSVTTGGTVSYETLPMVLKTRRADAFWWLKYLTAAIVLAGILFAIYGLRVSVVNSLEIFGTFACGAAFLHFICRFTRKPVLLTIIPLTPPIHILHDSQYQAIMDELMKRRRDRLRLKYATVDMLNTPAQEFWKFRQLRDEQVISETEYSTALRQLYMASDKTAAPSKLN